MWFPAVAAVPTKNLGLGRFLQPFDPNQSSTGTGSAGSLESRHHPCNEKESLRGWLKIPILGPHPSGGRRRGPGAYAPCAPSVMLVQPAWHQTRQQQFRAPPKPQSTPNYLTRNHSVREEEKRIQPLQFTDGKQSPGGAGHLAEGLTATWRQSPQHCPPPVPALTRNERATVGRRVL